MRRSLEAGLAAWVGVGLASGAGAPPVPERLFPVAPPDEAVVDSRPVFEFGYAVDRQVPLRDLRLRILLAGETARYEFDQRRDRGFLAGEDERVLYRPRRPLPDGSYLWRVEAWNGVEWTAASRSFRLRVDTVPPADVETLRARFDPERHAVVLDWAPVTLDRDGRPEWVARYHVYRQDEGDARAPLREIGVVERPGFVDSAPAPQAGPGLLLYRVTAEDEAGNEAGRRR